MFQVKNYVLSLKTCRSCSEKPVLCFSYVDFCIFVRGILGKKIMVVRPTSRHIISSKTDLLLILF